MRRSSTEFCQPTIQMSSIYGENIIPMANPSFSYAFPERGHAHMQALLETGFAAEGHSENEAQKCFSYD